jgi:hypothetical protein
MGKGKPYPYKNMFKNVGAIPCGCPGVKCVNKHSSYDNINGFRRGSRNNLLHFTQKRARF